MLKKNQIYSTFVSVQVCARSPDKNNTDMESYSFTIYPLNNPTLCHMM